MPHGRLRPLTGAREHRLGAVSEAAVARLSLSARPNLQSAARTEKEVKKASESAEKKMRAVTKGGKMRIYWTIVALAVISLCAIPRPLLAYFGTLPPHAVLPTEAQCNGAVPRNSWEPRPENAPANNTVPSAAELAPFYAQPINFPDGPPASDFQRVDGNFTGTTDEILQWASCKWGMDVEVMRAQAFAESNLSAYTVGDFRTDYSDCTAGDWYGWQAAQGYCWQTYGLLQVKADSFNVWPMAWDSNAFNADFRGAYFRACMNGDISYYTDLTPVAGYPTYPNGNTDEMMWGCVGAWYDGGWYDANSLSYIATIKASAATLPWLYMTGPSASLQILSPTAGQVVSGSVAVSIALNQGDPGACYACFSLDGVFQTCWPAAGPFNLNTNNYVLNGHHQVQVDSYSCYGEPYYHAGVNITVEN
jgi:hypothetical protein